MTTKQLNVEIEVIALEGWFPEAAPARQSLHPGESATVDVTFRVVGDFDGQLWLSTASVPDGVTVAFSASPVLVNEIVTLTVTTSAAIVAGLYTLTIDITDEPPVV